MISEVGRHTQHNYAILDIVKFFKYLNIHLYKNGHIHRTQKQLANQSHFALHNLFVVFNQRELTITDKCK